MLARAPGAPARADTARERCQHQCGVLPLLPPLRPAAHLQPPLALGVLAARHRQAVGHHDQPRAVQGRLQAAVFATAHGEGGARRVSRHALAAAQERVLRTSGAKELALSNGKQRTGWMPVASWRSLLAVARGTTGPPPSCSSPATNIMARRCGGAASACARARARAAPVDRHHVLPAMVPVLKGLQLLGAAALAYPLTQQAVCPWQQGSGRRWRGGVVEWGVWVRGGRWRVGGQGVGGGPRDGQVQGWHGTKEWRGTACSWAVLVRGRHLQRWLWGQRLPRRCPTAFAGRAVTAPPPRSASLTDSGARHRATRRARSSGRGRLGALARRPARIRRHPQQVAVKPTGKRSSALERGVTPPRPRGPATRPTTRRGVNKNQAGLQAALTLLIPGTLNSKADDLVIQVPLQRKHTRMRSMLSACST